MCERMLVDDEIVLRTQPPLKPSCGGTTFGDNSSRRLALHALELLNSRLLASKLSRITTCLTFLPQEPLLPLVVAMIVVVEVVP